ncbi:hypothetical protein ACFHW2_19585 [Actinomadura sp. LOL_016]|uniref:hypothetical protein n=1 Tax=unclassified Actinomadura TaxID=2626254 RepID=UPI003A7F9B20
MLDPGERFAPVGGHKSDLPVVGQLQVAAGAALVLPVSVAIGAGPRRPGKPGSRHGRHGRRTA